MTSRKLRTAIPFMPIRGVPVQSATAFAEMAEQSGVVDDFWVFDQVMGWWPQVLWRPENSPLAKTITDTGSFYDARVIAGAAGAAGTRLGLHYAATDAIRHGPEELCQTMYTLADLFEGPAMCGLGAGELKQTGPFGYKRSEGLARLEDILRIARLFWEAGERPIDFDGHHWKLSQATIGGVHERRPEFWAVGGGPKLIDIAAQHADGWISGTPWCFPYPDDYAKEVVAVRERVERSGGDPGQFGFGLQVMGLVHEDRDVIAAALDNPLIKWIAPFFGRVNTGDWAREGIQSALPPGYHYALHYLPVNWTQHDVLAVLEKTPPAMVEKTFYIGTPDEVARALVPFAEAGCTLFQIADMLPLVTGEQEPSIRRLLDICRALKRGMDCADASLVRGGDEA